MNIKLKNTGRQGGATLIEYAFMIALIAMVVMAGVALLGRETNALFQKAVDNYPNSGS